MGIKNKDKKKEEQAQKAMRTFVEKIQELYDYDLQKLINEVEEELKKREEKRGQMINSIEDMCKHMMREKETSYTFYYEAMTPRDQLMAENDGITDSGYRHICSQLGEKGVRAIQYGYNTFLIKKYPQENNGACFDVEIIEHVDVL